MTPDELRALAYALDDEDFEFRDSPMQVRRKWADYLRAQADAQPVATLTLLDDIGAQIDFHQSFTLLPGQTFSLYTHPAPAAPHYAMLDSHRRQVEQAIQSAEHPSGMSTHDGKAHIDASILRRMLAIIDSLPAAPQAERDEAWAERDAMAKDAERYQFLRAHRTLELNDNGTLGIEFVCDFDHYDDLDAAIDAQIEQEKANGNR